MPIARDEKTATGIQRRSERSIRSSIGQSSSSTQIWAVPARASTIVGGARFERPGHALVVMRAAEYGPSTTAATARPALARAPTARIDRCSSRSLGNCNPSAAKYDHTRSRFTQPICSEMFTRRASTIAITVSISAKCHHRVILANRGETATTMRYTPRNQVSCMGSRPAY